MARDHVTEHALGFDCIVNGRRFGTWRSRGEAVAGMKTEQLRALKRAQPTVRVPSPDRCSHVWAFSGTAYGGDDARWHGEGRSYCELCGADGDA